MKTIAIPQDIEIKDFLTGKVDQKVSFVTYAFGMWMNDAEAVKTTEQLLAWMKLCENLKANAKAGGQVHVEDAQHALLVPVVQRAALRNPPLFAAQLMPFHDAVVDAKDASVVIADACIAAAMKKKK